MSIKSKLKNTLNILICTAPLTLTAALGLGEHLSSHREYDKRGEIVRSFNKGPIYYRTSDFKTSFGVQTFSIDYDRDGILDSTRSLIHSRYGFIPASRTPSEQDQQNYRGLVLDHPEFLR